MDSTAGRTGAASGRRRGRSRGVSRHGSRRARSRSASEDSEARSPLSELHQPPAAHGGFSDAHYRKEFLALEHKYDVLHKRHQKATQKLDRATSERHALRGEAEAFRKEVTKLRRTTTRLSSDNRKLEEELSTAKDYVKRVESRLVHGTNGKYILEQNAKLREALHAAKAEAQAQAETVSAHEAELQKATVELEVLSRAVELRAEELKLDGDVQTGMLYAVATHKEDVRKLRLELADKTREALELETQAEALKAQLDEVVMQRSVATEHAAVSAADLDEERSKNRRLNETVEKLSRERDVTLEYVQELAEKVAFLSKRASEAEAQVAELRAAGTSDRLALQAVESKQEQMRRVQDVTENSLAAAKARLSEAAARAEAAEVTVSRQQEELKNVHADVHSLSAQADELRARLDECELERSRLQHHVEELSSENVRLRGDTEATAASKAAGEHAMQATIDTLQHELQEARAGREQMAASVHDLTNKHMGAVMDADNLRAAVGRLEAENAALQRSKTMLQQTLVSQLAQVRDELAREQRRNAGVPSGSALSTAGSPYQAPASARHAHNPRPTAAAGSPTPVSPPRPHDAPSVSDALAAAHRASLDAAATVRDSQRAEQEFHAKYPSPASRRSPPPTASTDWRRQSVGAGSGVSGDSLSPRHIPRVAPAAVTPQAVHAAALREIESRVAAAEAAVANTRQLNMAQVLHRSPTGVITPST